MFVIQRIIITIDDKIRDLKFSINRAAANISALLLGKIDKYEYLTVETLLPTKHSRTDDAKLPIGKAFEKQVRQTQKQVTQKLEAI